MCTLSLDIKTYIIQARLTHVEIAPITTKEIGMERRTGQWSMYFAPAPYISTKLINLVLTKYTVVPWVTLSQNCQIFDKVVAKFVT